MKTLGLGKYQLLATRQYSDFLITCDQHSFEVHRAILEGESEFLDRAMTNGMRESIEQHLSLGQEKPETIFLILWYLYTRKYASADMFADTSTWTSEQVSAFQATAPPGTSVYITEPFLAQLDVYRLADALLLSDIQKLASETLQSELHDFYGSCLRGAPEVELLGANYENAISRVFGDAEPVFTRLQDLFAYIGYKIANMEEMTALRDDSLFPMRPLFENYPTFGWHIFKETLIYNRFQYSWKCRLCGSKDDREWPTVPVIRNKKVVDIECDCMFRGFCQSPSECRAIPKLEPEHIQINVPLYCRDCFDNADGVLRVIDAVTGTDQSIVCGSFTPCHLRYGKCEVY